jgi:hypothetical protein
VEIGALVVALVELDLIAQARELQVLYDDFLHLVRAASGILRAPLLEADGQPAKPDETEEVASIVERVTWKLQLL